MSGSITVDHEAPLDLFREAPALVLHLIRDLLEIPLPRYDRIRVEDSDLSQVVPASLHADLVLTLCAEGETPVMAVVVEVQRQVVADKPSAWVAYVAALHRRLRCPVELLVFALDADVAAWARRPFRVGRALRLTPLVIGPDEVPRITSEEEARKNVDLAALSAVSHARGPKDTPIAVAAVKALIARGLDTDRHSRYLDLIRALHERYAKDILESLMTKPYVWKSEWGRQLARDMEEAKANGRAEGMAEGRARGMVQGEALALLKVLGRRGLVLSEDARERILSCGDLTRLERWLDRALDCRTVEELFDEG